AVTEVDRVDAPVVQDVPEQVAAENRVVAVRQTDRAASENGVEVTGADIGPGDLELLREQLPPRRVLVELLLRRSRRRRHRGRSRLSTQERDAHERCRCGSE